MKNIFLALALFFSITIFSQETINEGVAISKMTMSSDNEQANAQFASMGDIVFTTYFKGSKSHTEMSNPMMGSSIIIIDGELDKMLMMMNNPMAGKKYVIKSSKPTEEELKDVTITKGDETKTILGYVCQEYNVVTKKNGQEASMDIYTTDKLSIASQQASSLGSEFKGYPMYLKMTMSQMGMNMVMENQVTEIKKETVSSDKFSLEPLEGYEKTDKLGGM